MTIQDFIPRLLIDGRLVDGAGRLAVIDPATGEAFADAPRADRILLDQAVAAARRVFPLWSGLTIEDRRAKLLALADALEARFQDLVALLTREQGKPLHEAGFEVGATIGILRGVAGQASLQPKVLRDGADARILALRVPLGVVGVITPWNFPLLLLATKLSAALITGNTVVAKPAPTTPLTTLLLGEIAASILPAGVLNIVVDDNDLGEALTSHPDVAKIAFTGSTATGRKVVQSAAGTLKRVTLELGGNDAALVLDDADPAVVAPAIFAAAMLNAGQVCVAAKRVYVPAALHDAVCDQLARLADQAVVDDGARPGTGIGPLQNRQQYERVKALIEDSRRFGTVIAGGEALERPGYFIRPTIVRDIPDDSRLVREEQFGPVLPVLRYDDLDEAITRINDSEYGLAGTIWTSDPARAIAIAGRIEAGTVWINKFMDMQIDVPFGGAKQSGIGAELGEEGLAEYTQTRIINAAV